MARFCPGATWESLVEQAGGPGGLSVRKGQRPLKCSVGTGWPLASLPSSPGLALPPGGTPTPNRPDAGVTSTASWRSVPLDKLLAQ